MLITAIVGNPPYQAQKRIGNNNMPAIYHLLIDLSSRIGIQISLITPARFLFNIGGTPKEWNSRILNSEHFRVIEYIDSSSKVFPNVSIKGGVTITEFNNKTVFDKIHFYIQNETMRHILNKVTKENAAKKTLSDIASSTSLYHFTNELTKDHPSANINSLQISSNINEKIGYLFSDTIEENDISIYMRYNNKRTTRYINKKYIKENNFLNTYNVIIPKANGNGKFGEAWGTLMIGTPRMAHTCSFFSIGEFATDNEATACMKYLKTKFVRSLTSLTKTTQNTSKNVFQFVPLQDFTSCSDIDWTKTIPKIDQQLYKKYKLSADEINYIENHVQLMC